MLNSTSPDLTADEIKFLCMTGKQGSLYRKYYLDGFEHLQFILAK